MGIGDVFFVLFRRKYLILAFALLGLLVAAGIYFLSPTIYVSEARLMVRYVIERKSVNPTSPDSQIQKPDSGRNDIVAAEFEKILAQLRPLVQTELKRVEDAAEAAGAPWTSGRIPEWRP